MADEQNQNQNKGGDNKSGATILQEIRDKNFVGELGAIKKQMEEKVPLLAKAEETAAQIRTELTALSQKYDDVQQRRKDSKAGN